MVRGCMWAADGSARVRPARSVASAFIRARIWALGARPGRSRPTTAPWPTRVALLRDHGRVSHYLHQESGYNARMDTLQAAVLLAKLERLEEWNARRRAIARRYGELLAGCGVHDSGGARRNRVVLSPVRGPQPGARSNIPGAVPSRDRLRHSLSRCRCIFSPPAACWATAAATFPSASASPTPWFPCRCIRI